MHNLQFILQALLSAVVLLLICQTMTHAQSCDVSAAEVTLEKLDRSCTPDSVDTSCGPAMNAFCDRVTYDDRSRQAFGTLETISFAKNLIVQSCVEYEQMFSNVEADLPKYHSKCNGPQYYDSSIYCTAAAYLMCKDKLSGSNGVGVIRPAGNNHNLFCYRALRKEIINWDVLQPYNSKCNIENAVTVYCLNAIWKWCQFVGYSGGIPLQASTANGIHAACYDAAYSGIVYFSKTTRYYEYERRVVKVCDLDFNVDSSVMLSNSPEILKTETYDNRGSSVDLTDMFTISKDITTTSSFTHEHTFSIGAEVTTTARIPLIGEFGVTLSTSYSAGISMTTETTKTVSYTTESSVLVPPGEAIVKEAIIQRATVDVPWTATAINALGHKQPIRGSWIGTDTFSLRVEQVDLENFSV